MADYSKLSDAELMALVQPPAQDYGKMSDADLMKLVQPGAPSTPGPSQPMIGNPERGRQAIEFGKDISRAVGGGLIRGAMAIPDIADAAQRGVSGVLDKVLGAPSEETQKYRAGRSLTSDKVIPPIERALGTKLDASAATTPEGKKLAPYAQTAAEYVPMAAATGGGAITGGIIPGIFSHAAGQLAEGSGWEGAAKFLGGITGGIVGPAARRVVTPNPTNAGRTAAVDTLRGEGVTDITAGQATGRKGLQYLEAERGAGNQLAESAGEQFTAAALRRVGENNANRATTEVVDRAFTRIGGQFDALAARNTATLDRPFVNDVRQTVGEYFNQVQPPNRVPAVTNYVDEIINHAQRNGGVLPGDVYQSIRSRMEATARGTSNPEARNTLRDIRGALDDVMERSISASGNQADLGAWREARNQYRNLLVIEKAATGAGEGAAAGLISPAKLREATVNTQGRRNYARGDGDFADLARSGVQIMTPLPNSGTPGRLAAQNLGVGVSSVVGGLLGGGAGTAIMPGVGMSLGGAAGAMAGAIAPRIVGQLATSRAGRAYLSNQILEQTPQGRIARALMPAAAQYLRP